MKSFEILYTSSDIHKAIRKLFGNPSTSDSRVAIVAYVGANSESYLPSPDGLRVICSPSPGATDANAIRNLISRGANVQFSDRLHMKVYWSRIRGCVIGSANASSNALGVNGLQEAGVFLPPGTVSIRRLLSYVKPREIRRGELRALDRKPSPSRRRASKGKTVQAMDYLKWYKSPERAVWKCGWSDDEVSGTSKTVKEEALAAYGKREPKEWISVAKGRIRENDWVLRFTLTDDGVRNIYWQYVDFLIQLNRKDKRYYSAKYPYNAVQVNPSSHYPLPPFAITPSFRSAFNRTLDDSMRDRILSAKTDVPAKKMIDTIAEFMKGR